MLAHQCAPPPAYETEGSDAGLGCGAVRVYGSPAGRENATMSEMIIAVSETAGPTPVFRAMGRRNWGAYCKNGDCRRFISFGYDGSAPPLGTTFSFSPHDATLVVTCQACIKRNELAPNDLQVVQLSEDNLKRP